MLLLTPARGDLSAAQRAQKGYLGVKVVSVYLGNAARSKPSVAGLYLLIDATTGEPLALIDGLALTRWRTTAAPALAASHLAREEASPLVMVGAGALAPYLIAAHASERHITEVVVWNRNAYWAEELVASLGDRTPSAPRATLTGGAFCRPDEAVRRARLYVDTREGAAEKAGDIVQPLDAGVISEDDIAQDLVGLCRGTETGRRTAEEVTHFKSVSSALEDQAAATSAYPRLAVFDAADLRGPGATI
jgi:ornithine cyclodeaminase/alanine dehydrogenase-like protein (mu-crystallin family)